MSERLKAFISSEISQAWQERYAKNNIDLLAESLIQLEFCGPKDLPKSDWIFVSSKNAAQFLWNYYPDELKARSLAAVGKKTEEKLKSYGLKCDFVGNLSDTAEVGKKFKRMLGNQHCLFPTSNKTTGKVYTELNKNQFTGLQLYRTIEKTRKLGSFDLYLFTSPANVRAFMTQNEINKEAIIWCIGPSTAEPLNTYSCNILKISSLEKLLSVGIESFNKI